MADEVWANVPGAVTDFPIASHTTPPPLLSGAFTLGAGASGKKLEIVMLIDPADAQNPAKGGRVELMQQQPDGTWVPTGDYADWTGMPSRLTSRTGGTMNPPRVGTIVDLGVSSDPAAKVNRTLGVRGTLVGSPVLVGLGHRIF
jgi:hypothetical protein